VGALFEGFLHPALAWGALCAAVPLLIHLLNRQRHRPMSWAAMRFVQAAWRRTRRRAQLENLLLLLLRMAAVALLALALARPFVSGSSALAPLTEARRDVLLALDGSASTGYREGMVSLFDSILERAQELVSELDGSRGDRVRLVLADAQARVLSSRSPEEASQMLASLSAPSEQPLDLAVLLAEVVRAAEEESGGSAQSSLEVHLLTDLQLRTFRPPPPSLAAPAAASGRAQPNDQGASIVRHLDRLAELGVFVRVEDLGSATRIPANLGISALEPLASVLGAGLASEIGVRVENWGPQPRSGVRVVLEVDGERQPSRELDLVARSSAEAVFALHFGEGGDHTLLARLEGDRLAVDDARAAVVRVPPPIRVLLVNGDPHAAVDRDEIGFLRAVLEPADDGALGSFAPFVVSSMNAASFVAGKSEIPEFDALWLANVGALSVERVELLEARVAAGAALIVSLGDRSADPAALDAFNARFHRVDRTGLSPARLLRAVPAPTARGVYRRVATFDAEHPALSFFADERWRPFLTEVPVFAFVASEPIEGAAVLARLDDEGASPLLVERAYDRGRVVLLTSSIDADWNRLAESPSSLVPLVHELLRWAATPPRGERNLPLGASFSAEVPVFPRSAALVRPAGGRAPIEGQSQAVSDSLWRLPSVGPLNEAGLWRVEVEGAPRQHLAVQIDAKEGDLERIDPEELARSHRTWQLTGRRAGEGQRPEPEESERGELWRALALAALLALIGETLWAAWIGRGRRLA
jgi:hypothetical protein